MDETTWSYNIQDFSPLLEYSGGSGGSSQSSGLDPAWSQSCPVGSAAILGTSPVTICDLSSVHTTSVDGASVSLSFYGKGIQFIGNVTSGMTYKVTVDDSTEDGVPSGQILADISNLSLGNHSASILAHPSVTDSTLSFESAIVTVGTGLTGANVTRSIVQDTDSSLTYKPTSFWFSMSFGSYGITSSSSNTTWHQIDAATSGSVTIPFTGHAILVYGLSRSWFHSPYRISLDSQPPTTLFGDSALSNTSSDIMYTDGLVFFQDNAVGSPHNLVIDNANGVGVFALDYVEIITISGGSPISGSTGSSKSPPLSLVHRQLLGVIIGPILGGLALLLVVLVSIIYIKRRRRMAARRRLFEHNTIPTSFDAPSSARTISRKTMSDAIPETYAPSLPFQPTRRRKTRPPPLHAVTSPTTTEDTSVEPQTAVLVISPESESEPVVSLPGPSNLHVQNIEDSTEELRAAGRDVNRIREIVGDPEPQAPRSATQGNGDSAEEIRAMRRDVWRLMAIVGAVDEEPPEYGSEN